MTEDKWVEKLKIFFRRYYWDDILQLANEYPDRRSIIIDFSDLDNFDRKLGEQLLEQPDEIIPASNNALQQLLEFQIEKSFSELYARFIHVPNKIPNRELRSKHLLKFVAIEGMIRKATEVRPKIINSAFLCMRCEHVTIVPQSGPKFTEPHECENESCGKRGPFKILIEKSDFVDAQKLQAQESPENLKGGTQPQSLDVDVEDDLAGIVKPGDRVIINGILRSHQRTLRDGKSPFYDLVLHSNSIEYVDKEFDELEISPEDEEEILALSQSPNIYELITSSIAPSIYGYNEIKEALAMQLFSGVAKYLPDGSRIRGDIHILFVGDPGIAKSQLLRYMVKLAPRGVFASGKSASSSGLTAAAVRDEMGDGRWTLEAGALVMADMGIAAVDEMDKMRSEDKSALHEAMEQQCYDDKTEILTENGWKLFRDLQKDERVASLTPDGNLEFTIPEKYVESVYEGDIYYIYSEDIDLAVTPNHNMFVSIEHNDQWGNFGLYRMDELPENHRIKFRKNASWNGEHIDSFMIPCKDQNNECSSAQNLEEPRIVKMDDWIELLGYLYSRGRIEEQKKVRIYYSSSYNYSKIIECLDKIGYLWDEDDSSIIIGSKRLLDYLRYFENFPDNVPHYVKNLSKEQIEIFISSMIMTDHSHQDHTNDVFVKSLSLADEIQEIALKSGNSARIRILHENELDHISLYSAGKSSENVYQVSLTNGEQNYPSVSNTEKHVKKENYSGKIYCVEVKDHVIYVRRNRKAIWCGNTISVAKAGIIATLKSRCALLGAANPKYGRFDRYEGIAQQINMPPALMSRFDLIFVMLDTPNEEMDSKIARHILKSHFAGELSEQRKKLPGSTITMEDVQSQMETILPPIDPEIMRKYVAYSRKRIFPVMSEDARKHLIDFYLDLRKMGEGKDAPVPVTARQLEALVRLAEASARLRLSNSVTLDDAKRTTRTVLTCLKHVGVDPDTGALDVDFIESGTTKSQRDKIKIVKEIIRRVGDRHANGTAPLDEVYAEAEIEQIDREHVEELVNKMSRTGDLLKPKKDHVRLV